MSPSRQGPPIQIYQDFVDVPQQVQRRKPTLAPSAMPLQPTRMNQYAPIQPSVATKKQMIEAPQISPTMPFPPLQQQYYAMVPSNMPEGVLYTDSPSKRMLSSSQPLMPVPSIQQPLLGMWDSNFSHFDQENFHMAAPVHDHYVDFPDPAARRGMLKRSYSETIPSNDRTIKRLKMDNEDQDIPDPSQMPIIEDDGRKPPYSYAQMIGMAILRAPGRRLTLANIYDWISTTFRFYREDPKTGWHNSIRHNLSLNKAFIKQERPKSDAGKGCYWMIQPGMELQFFKDKSRKNTGSITGMQQPFSSQPMMQTMPQPVSDAIQPRPWVIQSQSSMEQAAPERPQTAPVDTLPELDSDATVPASDPDLDDENVIPSREEQIPQMPPPSSPPVINSSPPVISRLLHQRTVSSPANIIRSSNKQRRRTQTGMDDSGYYSSLESSARRPRHVLPTSELGFVPSKKLGRAEQEIARIRSSSHDITPSGCRFTNAADAAAEARSSSPVRESPTKPPTTPPIVFKKPALPQSPSPNAQLRAFRQQMQAYDSPGKEDFFTDLGFSPGLKLGTPLFTNSFDDFFNDFNPVTPLASSPIKTLMSAKRSTQRTGVLANVTNKRKTPSKVLGGVMLKAPTSVGYTGSPLKKAVHAKHVEFFEDQENVNSLFDFGSFPDEQDASEGEELDISKGFSKIGSNNTLGPKLGGALRPPLGRSQTTRF